MADADGFNPWRGDCQGGANCHVERHKLRLEEFARYLPGRCAFTDVDGLFERRHRALFVEWKAWPRPRDLPPGQAIALLNLTRLSPHIWAVVALGDPITTRAHHFAEVHAGTLGPWVRCTPSEFWDRLRAFGEFFDTAPRPVLPPAEPSALLLPPPAPTRQGLLTLG